ncbi:hypothetical protein BD410DRAFT_831553 [Rickenella mellea]|uniref:Aminoglycoside phosphotransferase domain-containing protein n=1 Tax=Rickenella mellea TaxID=50990 RepID=A0A4Y7PQP5_9AGAM|nr:hypothetical protein BD410DRAFT_831553 [Rickenella mellea]
MYSIATPHLGSRFIPSIPTENAVGAPKPTPQITGQRHPELREDHHNEHRQNVCFLASTTISSIETGPFSISAIVPAWSIPQTHPSAFLFGVDVINSNGTLKVPWIHFLALTTCLKAHNASSSRRNTTTEGYPMGSTPVIRLNDVGEPEEDLIVDWDALMRLACDNLHAPVSTGKWSPQIFERTRLVRFFEVGDTSLVVSLTHVPRNHGNERWSDQMAEMTRKISSQVATMKYIASHTTIPSPRIIQFSTNPDGDGVGAPYIITTEIEGVQLDTVWSHMNDDERKIVLRQIVDILIQLSFHRFDKIGSLFMKKGLPETSKDSYYIGPKVCSGDINRHVSRASSSAVYTSAVDYWLTCVNSCLDALGESEFGGFSSAFRYAHLWFLRSLIPALYDITLDSTGFPLLPGDFSARNIMLTNVDSEPRITGIINWEYSSTAPTSSFAQYPSFITDQIEVHQDHHRRERNKGDQETFEMLLKEAETTSGRKMRIAPIFPSTKGIYLFEQVVSYDDSLEFLFHLFRHIFGDDEDDDEFEDGTGSHRTRESSFEYRYCEAIMRKGVLKTKTDQLDREEQIVKQARLILGKDVLSV